MIYIRDVSKIFNAGQPNEFRALSHIDLHIRPEKITVIRGPSGSGKTTLLSLTGCMARPTSGRIYLKDREISGLPDRFAAQLRRHTFGFIFQRHHLIPGLTVLENIMIPAWPAGKPCRELRARAENLLRRFDLEKQGRQRVEHLSGGGAQRVAIARALINDPAVIIADEPTSHLDSHLAVQFMETMGSLRDAGKTVIIASHDPLVFKSPLVGATAGMRDGQITEPSEA